MFPSEALTWCFTALHGQDPFNTIGSVYTEIRSWLSGHCSLSSLLPFLYHDNVTVLRRIIRKFKNLRIMQRLRRTIFHTVWLSLSSIRHLLHGMHQEEWRLHEDAGDISLPTPWLQAFGGSHRSTKLVVSEKTECCVQKPGEFTGIYFYLYI